MLYPASLNAMYYCLTVSADIVDIIHDSGMMHAVRPVSKVEPNLNC
jgi:hypothetical protein